MGCLEQTPPLEILAESIRRVFLHEAADIIVRLPAVFAERGKSRCLIVRFYVIKSFQYELLFVRRECGSEEKGIRTAFVQLPAQ